LNRETMTQDGTGDWPRTEGRDAVPALVAQVALALGVTAAAMGGVPLPVLGGWLGAVIVSALLRQRYPQVVGSWLVGGLVWGVGTAAVAWFAGAGPALHGALLGAGLAPFVTLLDRAPSNRHLALFAAPACVPAALVALTAGTLPALATPAILAVALTAAIFVQRERSTLQAALEAEQAARIAREFEVERLDDEVQRLRVESRSAGESRESLADELSNANQELAVLRSKAGALSNVLQRINPYDTETGLLTAEKFANVMNREWARMRRQELPLSLLLVSIDRFEEFREKQGRLGYEAALRRISDVLRHAGNRPGDVAARLGPGAFALLFPETEHKHVARLAETVRTRVRQLGIAVGGGDQLKVLTATVGMATVIPNNEITPETLRERVEAALYEAQFQGGDRSVRYRTMDSIRVEHWDAEQEGQLTADSVKHKLAVLGYDAQPKRYKPGEQAPSRRVPVDSVEAVVEGQLRIMLEGEARVLKPGDLLFIPKGLVTSVEVVGQRPVLCLEAIRA